MAPLKLSEVLAEIDWDDRFHAYKSVAPLKRFCGGRGLGGFFRFHAYKSVAPLKRDIHAKREHLLEKFPRLQKRGPIEAPMLSTASVATYYVSTLTKAWPH